MLSKLLIDKTKSGPKTIRLWDGRGMYLEITPKGGKWWRFKYWFDGRERRMSLGVYPDVSLADAREKREEARRKVAAGIDPGEQRKAEAVALIEAVENSFEAVRASGSTCSRSSGPRGTPTRSSVASSSISFPWLGARPIKAITAPELLAVLRRVECRGANETAHRAMQVCGRVFRYRGRHRSRRTRSVAGPEWCVGADQGEASRLDHRTTGSGRVAAGDRCLQRRNGSRVARCGSPHWYSFAPANCAMRDGRKFDFDKAEWRIPAARMKMRVQHIVPLSTQAIAVLRDLQQLTGRFAFRISGDAQPLTRR